MNKRDFLRLLGGAGLAASTGALAGCVVDPYPGYRAYDYYYYPDVNVYYSLGTGYYYYYRDFVWVPTRVLPPHIHLDRRNRRPLLIRQPDPWRWNHQHRERLGLPPRPAPATPPPRHVPRTAPTRPVPRQTITPRTTPRTAPTRPMRPAPSTPRQTLTPRTGRVPPHHPRADDRQIRERREEDRRERRQIEDESRWRRRQGG